VNQPAPADPGATMPGTPAPGLTGPAAQESGIGPGEDAPANIGPYRLIRVIGEGGMGLVYEAEQTEPLRRRVALKIVKRGMDTQEFVSRFESERQALALMDHPAIAKVFDAGATERGRPYFVMEYVEGIPINNYCDQNRLGLRERLDLFVLVCDGVQHAHQKAIIHRDLKPSNVLVGMVDGQPVPKIIDFGVAKAMDTKLFDSTLTTSAGQLVGTPEYMSPEQADMSGEGIDTRTDVYALGVILYELLVGKLPFDLAALHDEGKGFYDILRVIREEEPVKPSTRATTIADSDERAAEIAADRMVDRTALTRRLKGDLDWITMKALEKDRERRYETVRALANDIRRHLDFKPVSAGPPSQIYKVRKFVRRNRAGVAAASLLVMAVFLGIAGTTTGMIRARQAERHARVEAETARQVSDFLVDLFEVADPDQARGETITAREILDQGAVKIESELADQPETQARLLNTIGKVYRNLGLYEDAAPKLEVALALRREGSREDELDLAESLAELGDLYIDLGRYEEAEEVIKEAIEIQEHHGQEANLEMAETLNELAQVYRREGMYDQAEHYYQRARDSRVAVLGEDHPDVAASYNSLAILNWNRGRYDQAEALYKQALGIWRAAYGSDHSDVAKALNNLALLYHHLDRHDDAQPLYEEAIEIYERVLGPDHPRLATAKNNLGLVHYEMDRYDEAYPLYIRALAIREQALGPDHPLVAQTVNNLANLRRAQGRYEEAAELYARALRIRREAYRDEHPEQAWTLWDMGKLEMKQDRLEDALAHFAEAVAIYERVHGPDHPDLEEILPPYAEALRAAGREVEADVMEARVEQIAALKDEPNKK
jgi:non-specific serine/threonine protein kinase/serine/threonine-protein kinase